MTLAEIARLAGVGRAAVSNWRRRHDTFPPQIGGTDTSPHFSLTDIEKWLRDNGKLGKTTSREWLWPRFEALGDRDETGLAIATVGRLLARGESDGGGSDGAGAGPVQTAVELGRREGSYDILMFLLRRWLDTHVRQITTTPEPLADLMADLALRTRGPFVGEHSEDPLRVLDPACGAGHLLAAAAKAVPTTLNRPAALLGCDRDPVLTALTDVRLALLPGPETPGPAPVPVIAPGDSSARILSSAHRRTWCSATRRPTSGTGGTRTLPRIAGGCTAPRLVPSPNSPGCSTAWLGSAQAAARSCCCRRPWPRARPDGESVDRCCAPGPCGPWWLFRPDPPRRIVCLCICGCCGGLLRGESAGSGEFLFVDAAARFPVRLSGQRS